MSQKGGTSGPSALAAKSSSDLVTFSRSILLVPLPDGCLGGDFLLPVVMDA